MPWNASWTSPHPASVVLNIFIAVLFVMLLNLFNATYR